MTEYIQVITTNTEEEARKIQRLLQCWQKLPSASGGLGRQMVTSDPT